MIFADNIQQCTYAQIYVYAGSFNQPINLLPILALTCPFLYDLTSLFTYLENQLLLLVVRIPIHSCPWFALNCSPLAISPTPRHPADQVTYLHRWHQQRRSSRPTQYALAIRDSVQDARVTLSERVKIFNCSQFLLLHKSWISYIINL